MPSLQPCLMALTQAFIAQPLVVIYRTGWKPGIWLTGPWRRQASGFVATVTTDWDVRRMSAGSQGHPSRIGWP